MFHPLEQATAQMNTGPTFLFRFFLIHGFYYSTSGFTLQTVTANEKELWRRGKSYPFKNHRLNSFFPIVKRQAYKQNPSECNRTVVDNEGQAVALDNEASDGEVINIH